MKRASVETILFAAIALSVFAVSEDRSPAASVYWDGSGTSWNTASAWSTAANATTPNPAAPPGASDLAMFNISTVNTAQTVNLNAEQSALGLVFNSTGTVLIESAAGGGIANSLTLGVSGITVNSHAGSDTITSPVTVRGAQTWTNNSDSMLTAAGNVSIGSSLLTVTGTGNTTISGNIGIGSGGIVKTGAGTLAITAPGNNYSGGTAINGGILQVGADSNLGNITGGLSFDGGTLETTAGFTSARSVTINSGYGTIDASAGDLTLSGVISGAGLLTINDFGTVTLANASNNYAGGTTVQNGGTLAISSNANLGSIASTLTLTSGTIKALAGFASDRLMTLNAGGGTFNTNGFDVTLSGSLIGNDPLTKIGGGTLTVSGTTDNVGLTAAVSAGTLVLAKTSGSSPTPVHAIGGNGLTVNGGTAQLAGTGDDQIFDFSSVTVNSGTFDLNGRNETILGLSLQGTGIINAGALINSSANASTLAGPVTLNAPASIGGAGDMMLTGSVTDPTGSSLLTKVGNNTLTLSGTTDNFNLHVAVNSGTLVLAKTNTASNALAIGFGGLTVNGGTAQLAGAGNDQIWDSTDVTVTSGAFDTNGRNETLRTLYLQGTGINGTGALVNNASHTITNLTPTNGTVLTSNATIGPSTNAVITLNNTVSGNFALTKVGGGTLYLKGNNSFSGGLNIQSGDVQVSTVNNAATIGPMGLNTSVTLGANGRLTYTGLTSASTNMPFILEAGSTGGFSMTSDTSLTLNGTISGPGRLIASYGPLILGANNTFTGGVTIGDSATLQLANAGALNAASPNAVTMIGGTLSLNGNSVTVTGLSSSISAAIVKNGGTAAATLTVESSENSTFAGALGVGLDSLITLRKTGPGTLTLSGTVDNVGLAVAASSGKLILAKTSSPFPDVHAVGGGGLIVNGGTAQLAGTGDDQIWWGADGTVTSGTFDTNARNESMNSLALQGTGLAGSGALLNSAAGASSITPTNGTTLIGNTTIGVTQSSGALTLNNTISGNFALTKIGAGTLQLSDNSTFGGGFNLNQGKLLVKSPGAIGTGPLTIASAGTLGIEIDQSAGLPQYDHVNVVGQLTLGGSLNVALTGGFAPAVGNSFDILDWGTLIGTFASLQLPTLASGLQWNTSQLYTTGILSVESAGLPGDFNLNGIVDAADFVVWRKGLGATYTQSDYNIWRAHFGQTAGSGANASANAAVPEPATFVLLIFAAAGSCLRRSRAA